MDKKLTKSVSKNFGYLEYEKLASYLEEMARQGWHFTQWKSRLIFEKGEPQNAEYDVVIFNDAGDEDERPDYHTLEFSEYCEAAGWKLVAVKGKRCVFKKCREDAVEILPPSDKLDSAVLAEKSRLMKVLRYEAVWVLLYLVPRILLAFLYKDYSVLIDGEHLSPYVLGLFLLFAIGLLLSVAGVDRWHSKMKEGIASGAPHAVKRNDAPWVLVSLALVVMALFNLLGTSASKIPADVLETFRMGEAWDLKYSRWDCERGLMGQTTEFTLKFTMRPLAEETEAYETMDREVFGTLHTSNNTWVLDKIWNDWLDVGKGKSSQLDLTGTNAQEGIIFNGKCVVRFEHGILILTQYGKNVPVQDAVNALMME